MSDGTTIYRGYEIFSDDSYYNLIACRKVGVRSWHETQHFDTVEEAKHWVNCEFLPTFHYDLTTGERITDYKCQQCGEPSGSVTDTCRPCFLKAQDKFLANLLGDNYGSI